MAATQEAAYPSHLLSLYYRRLYPIQPIIKWLSNGNEPTSLLPHREFSFTMEGDVYNRYLFFRNEQHMKEEIWKLCPWKIDIGAVYSQPKTSGASQSVPVARELVFDIDMTDYDEVRTCCSGANICNKCWRFMSLACKILDASLREDFGFRHLLWVFSGRRGVHCWVCDQSARLLEESTRRSIANYLSVILGSKKKKVHFYGDKLHYCIKRAMGFIVEHFESIVLDDQDLLGSAEGVEQLLGMVEDEEVAAQLKAELSKHSTSRERWRVTTELIGNLQREGKMKGKSHFLVEEMMFQFVYPRLDYQVSVGMNHLLKAPYCIHPGTGKVCTPFSLRRADKFDPCSVPTIQSVLSEVDEFDAKNGKGSIKDYKKTSMSKSILVFEEFLSGLDSHRRAQTPAPSMEF